MTKKMPGRPVRKRVKRDAENLATSTQRAIADLARSGLTLEEMDAQVLEAESVRKLVGVINPTVAGQITFPATQFPYRGIDGQVIVDHAALRFHADAKRLERTGLQRYWTFDPSARDFKTANWSPRFYLSKLFDFEKVTRDVSVALHFTEGQKKSACACKFALPTIGLEGVDNFKRKVTAKFGGKPKVGSSKSVVIDDFELFVWVRRTVVITYDSDIDFKPGVRDAALRLAGELIRRGARVYYARLTCDCKVPCKGLDDFLVKHGRDAFLALKREPLDQVEMLSRDYVKLAKPPATFYDRRMDTMMNFQRFCVHTARIRTVSADGISIPAAERWNEETAVYTRLLFEPTAKPKTFIADPDFEGCEGFNVFAGLFCEPKRGDISLYLKLLEKLFPDMKTRRLFEQWAAYPVQNLGAKINWAWLLHSKAQGSGKTFLGRMVGALYGNAFYVINKPEYLHSKFNLPFEGKLFLLANEVISSRVEAERLKGLVTETEMEVERKGVDRYSMANHLNLIATSNRPDALKLTKEDRRWMVHEVPKWWSSLAERDKFFTDLAAWWYEDPSNPKSLPRIEAVGALLWHRQNEVSLAGFNASGDAPWSEAKAGMIEKTERDEETFARELVEEPLLVLGEDYRYAVPFKVLFDAFLAYNNRNSAKEGDAQALRASLESRGCEYVKAQKWVGKSVVVARLWILDANWRKGKSSAEIYDYYVANPFACEKAPFVLKDQGEKPPPGRVIDINRGKPAR